MNNKRGKNPNIGTIRELIAKSGGMCEFEGCGKRLFHDELTNKSFNNTNIAHIIASSPDGPRGNEKFSSALSDDIANLMLMCSDHHTLIDTKPEEFSIDSLQRMKERHEIKVERMCQQFLNKETTIIRFCYPINEQQVSISTTDAKDAVVSEGYVPMQEFDHVLIEPSPQPNLETSDDWEKLDESTKQIIENKLLKYSNFQHKYSIFALAPIPLLIRFGDIVGDKINADIYQKYRDDFNWKWKTNNSTNEFEIKSQDVNEAGEGVALILSLSGKINLDKIVSTTNPKCIYIINAKEVGVDCIKSKNDLNNFTISFLEVCETIKNKHTDISTIQLFPAVPVSVAFEIGRRRMKGVHYTFDIYNASKAGEYIKTITL